MPIEIEEHYAKTALTIMKNYDQVLKDKDIYLQHLIKLKDSILKMQIDVEAIDKNPDNSTDLRRNSELYKLIRDHEILIVEEEKKIQPFIDKVDAFKKQTEILYNILKEKYPGLSDNQLKFALTNAIEKIIAKEKLK